MEEILEVLSKELERIGVPYEFLEWTGEKYQSLFCRRIFGVRTNDRRRSRRKELSFDWLLPRSKCKDATGSDADEIGRSV